MTPPPCSCGPASLPCDELGAHLGVGRDDRHGAGHLGTPDLDRCVHAVDGDDPVRHVELDHPGELPRARRRRPGRGCVATPRTSRRGTWHRCRGTRARGARRVAVPPSTSPSRPARRSRSPSSGPNPTVRPHPDLRCEGAPGRRSTPGRSSRSPPGRRSGSRCTQPDECKAHGHPMIVVGLHGRRARAARLHGEPIRGLLGDQAQPPSSVTTAARRSVSWPRMNPTPRTRVGVDANTATAARVRAVSGMAERSASTPCSGPPTTSTESGVRCTTAPICSSTSRNADVSLHRPGAQPLDPHPAAGDRGGCEEVGRSGGVGLDGEVSPDQRRRFHLVDAWLHLGGGRPEVAHHLDGQVDERPCHHGPRELDAQPFGEPWARRAGVPRGTGSTSSRRAPPGLPPSGVPSTRTGRQPGSPSGVTTAPKRSQGIQQRPHGAAAQRRRTVDDDGHPGERRGGKDEARGRAGHPRVEADRVGSERPCRRRPRGRCRRCARCERRGPRGPRSSRRCRRHRARRGWSRSPRQRPRATTPGS